MPAAGRERATGPCAARRADSLDAGDRGQHGGQRRRDRSQRRDLGDEGGPLGWLGGQGAVDHQAPDVLERPAARRARPPSTGGSGRSPPGRGRRRPRCRRRPRPSALGARRRTDLGDAHEIAQRHDTDQLAVAGPPACGGSRARASSERVLQVECELDGVDRCRSSRRRPSRSPRCSAAATRRTSRSVTMPTRSGAVDDHDRADAVVVHAPDDVLRTVRPPARSTAGVLIMVSILIAPIVRSQQGFVNVDYDQCMRTLTAAEAATRLGVKVETVYAYVSRGVLRSTRAADSRSSLFDAADVEAIALRGRPRRVSRRLTFEVEIDTHLTEIDGHALRFRGRDAVELATSATFEQVAELLWTGAPPGRGAGSWAAVPLAVPPGGSLGDRLRLAVDVAAMGDPSRGDLRPEAVAACGRSMIASVVESLPLVGDGRTPRLVLGDGVARRGTVAGRLWTRLATVRPRPELVAVLNAALVLMIDHELAASTFAAQDRGVGACRPVRRRRRRPRADERPAPRAGQPGGAPDVGRRDAAGRGAGRDRRGPAGAGPLPGLRPSVVRRRRSVGPGPARSASSGEPSAGIG